MTRYLNPRWQCLIPTWQNSRWLPSSSWVRINEWSFFVQIVGTNLGKCEWVWEIKLKWLKPRWPNSRCLPFSSSVRMNEFESDWISLSQSQDGVRVFFEWIWEKITSHLNPRWQCLNPTLQNSRWLPSSSWVRMNQWSFFCGKWVNPWWQGSRWLPSSSSVRMNELESDWIRLSQSFVQHGWIQDGRIQYGRIQDGCHH